VSIQSTLNAGDLYAYFVYYRSLKGDDKSWSYVGTTNLNLTISDLIPGNVYGIRMTYAALGGNGIASPEFVLETIEGGMAIFS